jgi:hypothetical protein
MRITEMLARNARIDASEIPLAERRPPRDLRRELTWQEF